MPASSVYLPLKRDLGTGLGRLQRDKAVPLTKEEGKTALWQRRHTVKNLKGIERRVWRLDSGWADGPWNAH